MDASERGKHGLLLGRDEVDAVKLANYRLDFCSEACFDVDGEEFIELRGYLCCRGVLGFQFCQMPGGFAEVIEDVLLPPPLRKLSLIPKRYDGKIAYHRANGAREEFQKP
jgi:hypothetical protein